MIWRETLAGIVSGTLYIVATPIGNLEDLSPRAARILAEVGLIACEDTRQTRKLLEHLGLRRPLVSFHEHNEKERCEHLLERLEEGVSVALVSDAGTPTISDPGYRLVRQAIARGVAVTAIPGPNAAVTALCASGLPTDAFYFGGFFPAKRNQRVQQLKELKDLPATLIFYESPHRILASLEDVAQVLGERPVVVARELTKVHEEFLRGSAASIRQMLEQRPAVRGEMTVLIAKAGPVAEPAARIPSDPSAALERYLAQGMSRMQALKAVAKDHGLSKRELYRFLEKTSRRQ
ncbi:MAG: 16S rRNA (cytidine(1402)-2'-O)-methyltransferase [Bryobacteraceae bacterium]|nr:16S rRNA (cytidine(1402)-2'-O)-methyltransferase [Bryobacteraceae bacterium]MDW8379185.1 16S rRNA (cytidine(1402)-2'-O)-methyltransferase [Bryobacterales bacterium]